MMMVGRSKAGAALRGPYGVMIKAATCETETSRSAAAVTTLLLPNGPAEMSRQQERFEAGPGKKRALDHPGVSENKERYFAPIREDQETRNKLGSQRLFPGQALRIWFAEPGCNLIEPAPDCHEVHRQVAAICSRSLSGESPSAVKTQREFPCLQNQSRRRLESRRHFSSERPTLRCSAEFWVLQRGEGFLHAASASAPKLLMLTVIFRACGPSIANNGSGREKRRPSW